MLRKTSFIIKELGSLIVLLIGVSLFISNASADQQLSETHWRLLDFQSMDDATGVLKPHDPSLYTMSLYGDGRVEMQLNCNTAKGKWSAEPSRDGISGSFKFGPLASTRALCPPPTMDQHIIADAKYIRGYLLKNGRLHLSLMADGGIYTWEPLRDDTVIQNVYISPEEGGPRNWEVTGFVNDTLNLREKPSARAKIIDRFELGTILDNLGCQPIQGHTWCDVQKFGGGARGYVSSKFIKPAISPDGGVAKGPDDSALRAGQGEFDAKGNLTCSFLKEDTMKECEFGVSRAGGGYATVVITKPDGAKRAVYFRMGKAIGADTSQADGYPDFRSNKESDWNLIHVGNEFYKIPDAVIFGG